MTHQHGDTIVEGLVALAILSIGLLGIIGVQGTLIGTSADAQLRMEASFYAEQLLGLAIADAANANCYAFTSPCGNADASASATAWRAELQDRLPGAASAAPTVTYDAANGQFAVVVQWRHPSDDTVRSVASTTVLR